MMARDRIPDAIVRSPRLALVSRHQTLLYGVVGPPLAWVFHVALVYGLAYPAAYHESRVALYVVSAACVSLTAQGIWLGFGELHRLAHATSDRVPVASTQLLAKTALVLGTFFTLVVLAQTLPFVILGLGD